MAQREQRVTPLEHFFYLVFVYALTQVTQLTAHDATWPGVGGGLLVLAALWWAWSGYAWLTNALEPEAGAVRAGMFGAMAAMLLVALAVPGAFGAEAVLFGVAYVLVRLLNLGLDALAAQRDPDLRGALGRFAPTATLASGLLLVAGFVGGPARVARPARARGRRLRGRGRGWRVAPAHFAERHGLIVLIALGKSIVALGVGASGVPFTPAMLRPRSWASSSSRRSGGRTSTSSPSWRSASWQRPAARSAPGSRSTTTPTCTCR